MLTKEQQANIHAGLQTGETYAQIAERCGVKPWTVSNYARRHGIKRTRGWKVTGWPSPLVACYLELRGLGLGPTETGAILGATRQAVANGLGNSRVKVAIGEFLDEDAKKFFTSSTR